MSSVEVRGVSVTWRYEGWVLGEGGEDGGGEAGPQDQGHQGQGGQARQGHLGDGQGTNYSQCKEIFVGTSKSTGFSLGMGTLSKYDDNALQC